jgi:hypothetical protein
VAYKNEECCPVVQQRAAILELLLGKDKALLVWRDALFVLDLGPDIVNGVGRLDLKNDRLTGEGLHQEFGGVRKGFGARRYEKSHAAVPLKSREEQKEGWMCRRDVTRSMTRVWESLSE